jgi:hypothetical protein
MTVPVASMLCSLSSAAGDAALSRSIEFSLEPSFNLMLTRIIIIYIAVTSPRKQGFTYGYRPFEPRWGDLVVFAQACWDQQQAQQLKQAVRDERHQSRGNGTRQDRGHVV